MISMNRLPEIKWDVRKGNINIDCAACGHNSILKSAHKLVTYIIKNPPGGATTVYVTHSLLDISSMTHVT
jgi:hypothetical protein